MNWICSVNWPIRLKQRWEALASEEDLQATAQSLIGTTAQLYWQLGYLNERYSVVQQNLATAQRTYDLVNVQYRAGAVSGLDLTQAEQAIQSQQATLSQIEQQRVETRTALAVLMNMPVQQLDSGTSTFTEYCLTVD